MRLKKKIIFILVCFLLLLIVFLLSLFLISDIDSDERDYPKLDVYEAVMECIKDNDPDHGNIYRYYIYNNNGDYYYIYVHESITIKGSKEDIIERGDITSIDDFDSLAKSLESHSNLNSVVKYTYKVDDYYQTFDNVKEFKKCFGKIK